MRDGLAVRFGDKLMEAGHTSIPNLILDHYLELGISNLEMMVVIHIWKYWWTEKMPYPGLRLIAAKTGLTRRQVQSHISSLCDKGLLEVKPRADARGAQLSSEYDFTRMLERLRELPTSLEENCTPPLEVFCTPPRSFLHTLLEENCTQIRPREEDPIEEDPELVHPRSNHHEEIEMPITESSPLVDQIISDLKEVFTHITDPALWRPKSFAAAVKRYPNIDHLEEIQLLAEYADRHPKYVKAAKDPAGRVNTWFRNAAAHSPKERKPKPETKRAPKLLPTPTQCEPWDEMKENIALAGETRPAKAWNEIDSMRVEQHGHTIIAYSDVTERKDTVAQIVQRYIKRTLDPDYEVQFVSPSAA